MDKVPMVLPIQGKKDAYIAMFDKWNKTDLIHSTYIWLPIQFREDGSMAIPGWIAGHLIHTNSN